MSKYAIDMQEMRASVLKKYTIRLLLTLTGKVAAYLLSLSLTAIILCSCDSHLESEAESVGLSELCMLELSGMPSISVDMCLGV